MRLIPTGEKMKTPFEILLRRREWKMDKANRYAKLHPERIAAIASGQARRKAAIAALEDSDSIQQSQMLKAWNHIRNFFGDSAIAVRNQFIHILSMLRKGLLLRQAG